MQIIEDKTNLKAVELHISPERKVVMLSTMEARRVEMPMGASSITTLLWNPFFYERVDDNSLIMPAQPLHTMPWGFHACCVLTGTLLMQSHQREMAYEGQAHTPFSAKALIDATVFRYGIEADEIIKFYPQARMALSHKALTHPTSFEALLSKIRIKTKRKLN